MKNDNENEAIETNELFIEELGEVRGGVIQIPGLPPLTTVFSEDPGIRPIPPFVPPGPKPIDPVNPGPVLPKPPSIPFLEDGPLPRFVA
jgi:hypothetical protein